MHVDGTNYGAIGIFQAPVTIYNTPTPTHAQAQHQLRAATPDLIGRAEVLTRLTAALRRDPNQPTALIGGVRGMGGIGKTELVYAVAGLLQADYPDAQLLLELRGVSDTPLSPAQALQQAIRAFLPEEALPEDLTALQARYRSLLSNQHTLIVADDARDAAQVRPLVPPAGCALLVSSRQRFTLDGMYVVDLEQLDEAAAIQLLRGICARLDAVQAGQIARLCGGLPLALRISAGILSDDPALPIPRYLRLLEDERQRLDQLRNPDDAARDVTATLHLSYAALDAPTQTLFPRLGVLAADADIGLAAAVLDQNHPQAEALLRQLLRRNLVEYDPVHDRWDLHDLVRVYAIGLLAAHEEHPARLRCIQHLIGVLEQASRRYLDGGEGVQRGLALFDQEYTHLDAARAWLWSQPPDHTIDTLLISEARATLTLGELRDPPRTVRIPQWEHALAAARRQGDRHTEGIALGCLGAAFYAQGAIHTAVVYLKQHLHITRELGDRRGEGWALGNLGSAFYALGETHAAIDCYQQDLTIARELGDQRGEGITLGNLGIAYCVLGETHTATGYLAQHLTIARALGDQHSEGWALGNLGSAYADLGHLPTAIDYLDQQLRLARTLGDRHSESWALGNLGSTYRDLGELHTSLGYLEQHLAIARHIDDRCGEGWALGNLGSTYRDLGELHTAHGYLEQHLAIARQTGDRRGQGWALGHLGTVYAALGQVVQAHHCYTQSLTLLERAGSLGETARRRWDYGLFLVRQGEHKHGLMLMAVCVSYEQHVGHTQANQHAALLAEMQTRYGSAGS